MRDFPDPNHVAVRSVDGGFSSNDTGLSNFRFERVAANSVIQAARMYRGRAQEVLMKTLVFRETGEPKSVLQLAEIPTPHVIFCT